MSPRVMFSNCAVLVVEDEPLVRLDAMDLVTDSGLSVYGAPDAATAITMLERHADIRILLADIEMPGAMNGLKLAHAVRERWPDVVILIASGNRGVLKGDMPDRAVFFLKPYAPSAIMQCLRDSASGTPAAA